MKTEKEIFEPSLANTIILNSVFKSDGLVLSAEIKADQQSNSQNVCRN